MLKLKPLKASVEPAEMLISNGEGAKVVLENILVGEVWHASGQSNMEWFANRSLCSVLAQEIRNAKDELPIREFRTDTVSALYPQIRVTSEKGWKTSRMAGDFSALALSFAHELQKELKVPVGILLTSHSNTRIEAFTERKAIESHPGLKADAELIRDGDVSIQQGRAAFEKFYRDLAAWQSESAEQGFPVERPLKRPNLPGIAGEWRGPSQFFNGKIAPVVPYAIRGSIWCQGESNSSDGRLYAARMEALVRGWREAWGQPDMPFYFTQMQNYGSADSEEIGYADLRQVQHLFFQRNRDHVGMVVQTDLNPAAPGNIHYQNKLHPGMRLARWALAKQYGRDIAFTGPIYERYFIDGNKAIVSFEKHSLFGGLMVGGKGLEKDFPQNPDKFVEPARPTPGEKLKHFRLCGKDRKWHAAEAVIVGDTVVVTSQNVSEPIGVQYAYSEAPQNANLYNKAGLPATPFAAVNGELIFEEDDLGKVAALQARYAPYTDPDYPILQVAEYYRDGAIIQRDQPIPVWGHANKGVEVTVTLGGLTRTTVASERQQWSVSFPAFKASTNPITLSVKTSHGHSRTVPDILVGDVWFVTGGMLLTTELALDPRDKPAAAPEALPLLREFRRRTAASTNAVPRKRGFEVGGGRYRTFWQTADFTTAGDCVSMFAYEFARSLSRPGVPQGFVTMSSGQAAQMASPLSWTSFAGVKDVTHPAFRKRLNALLLQDPNSEVARQATAEYVRAVQAEVAKIVALSQQNGRLTAAPLQFPAFPEPGQNGDAKPDTVPTLAYNWCISPLTPMAVAGVIWVPGSANLGYMPADYSAELELYARSLSATYGQRNVPFFYAQPSSKLVPGITTPKIENATSVEFDKWPNSLREIAQQLGAAATKARSKGTP
jgi:sialate O-acetylesterase